MIKIHNLERRRNTCQPLKEKIPTEHVEAGNKMHKKASKDVWKILF